MERVACPDCDLLHASMELGSAEEARCRRCGTGLPLPRPAHATQTSLAIATTAAAAFAVAVCLPLMSISAMGHTANATLPETAAYMWYAGSPLSGVFVALFAVFLPAAHLGFALASGIGALRSAVPPWAGLCARYARVVAPWAMPEVMLLATLVAYVKISQLADAAPGPGMFATGALAVLLALWRNASHLPTLWSRIPASRPAP